MDPPIELSRCPYIVLIYCLWGTIKARRGFDQSVVASTLRDCMKGIGTEEGPIIKELCTMNCEQRQWVKDCYKASYGKDLVDDIKSELTGDFEDVVVAVLMKPREYDAHELNKALSGIGTTESTLVEIMATRSNEEIEEIKAIYEEKYGETLESALDCDTGGYFGRLMISLCTAAREGNEDPDEDLAQEDAQKFFDAGEARWGTDEAELNRVLCLRSPAQLRATYAKFEELSGTPIEESIDNECSGSVAEGYKALVMSSRNMPEYFAKRANTAMAGFGTSDNDLIRLIVSRSEVDLEDIKASYAALYDTSLADAVASECSGDYKRMLIHILDPEASYD